MKRLITLFTIICSLAGTTVKDPYDSNTYDLYEKKTTEVSVKNTEIGAVKDEGEWMDAYFYVGTDGFQSVVVSNDIYERKVGVQTRNKNDVDLFCAMEPLKEKYPIACVRNLVPGSAAITIYYRMLTIDADITALLAQAITDTQLQTFIIKVEK